MKTKYLFILIALIFLTSGCWNYRELNQMAIVGSIGIDYDKEKELFDVSVQVFKAKKTSNQGGSSSEQSPVVVYQEKAKTIHEALRNVVEISPKKLYIGHLDLIVFGEDLAKEHFLDAMDFLFRDAESRKDFNIALAKNGKASDVLKVLTPLETNPSASLTQTMLANDVFKGSAPTITFDEALSFIYGPGVEMVLPTVEVKGEEKDGEKVESVSKTVTETKLIVNSMAVFKGSKLIGYLSEEESVGYSFISGKIKSSVISFPCDNKGNYGSIEIISAKSAGKVNVKKEKISGKVEVTGNVSLSELNCKYDLTNETNVKKVQKMANKRVEEIINKTLDKAMNEYNSDIFGFGEQIYHNYYDFWLKKGKDWDKIFKTIPVEVKSDLSISTKGSITNATKEEK